MIKLSYEEMLDKIEEKSGIKKPEIEIKIDAKLKQLSGLISKEGAAHIVANELGVGLFEQASGKLQIKELKPGMRNVETVGKVLNIYEVREFTREGRVGKVGSLFIGDETGRMRVVCWGTLAEKLNTLSVGDIVALKGGYIKENNNFKEIHMNDRSSFAVNPPGETIGDVGLSQSTRKKISEVSTGDSNIELFGHIVQIFDPRFYEICPECGKRVRNEDGNFNCPVHGPVIPDFSYVLNFVIDDGSGTMRIVCFRNQVESLLSKKTEEVLVFKESPESFLPVKNSLLGNPVKVMGRASNNEMFDRLEVVSSSIDMNPDPEEELKRLNAQ